MSSPRLLQVSQIPACWLLLVAAATSTADVVVLSNRVGRTVRFSVNRSEVKPTGVSYSLSPGDAIPVFVRGAVYLQMEGDDAGRTYQLGANSAYFFILEDAQLNLQQIDLGGDAQTLGGRDLPEKSGKDNSSLPVRLYVDDEQAFTQRIWEPKLRKRLAQASKILRKYSGVGFQVVGVGTWESDDQIDDFTKSLLEFTAEVESSDALAIGFSGQYELTTGKTHLGGTRFPLARHILIRERAPKRISEAERLEVLVHELGHHLGAAHSNEADSVMRPILGDRIARSRSFRIKFDPVNTLAMSMIGEEIRARGVRRLADLSNPTRFRLRQIYTELAMADPQDSVPQKYIMLLQ